MDKNKIFVTLITILFLCLIMFLIQHDNIGEFIPLRGIINGQVLPAYDVFLLFFILMTRVIFRYHQINILSELKKFAAVFNQLKLKDIVTIGITGVCTYFGLWPVCQRILDSPISAIKASPEPIRHTIIVALFAFWIYVLHFVNKGGCVIQNRNVVYPVNNQTRTTLPQPPAMGRQNNNF